MEDTKRTYPEFTKKAWVAIRDAFTRKQPTSVADTYLTAQLGVEKKTANKYIRYLRHLGLLDEENRPTERANKWRQDSSYKDACDEILEDCYDTELQELAPDYPIDRAKVNKWFMDKTGCGDGTAGNRTAFFDLLREGNPDTLKETKTAPTKGARKVEKKKKVELIQDVDSKIEPITQPIVAEQTTPSSIPRLSPSIHIDIQIHIPSNATETQIDAIFSSMSKHLYGRE